MTKEKRSSEIFDVKMENSHSKIWSESFFSPPKRGAKFPLMCICMDWKVTWMMEDGYWKLKEKAQHREEWSRWTFWTCWEADHLKKKINIFKFKFIYCS